MPEIQTLADGLLLGESPRWHDGRLWLADWIAQEILAVDLDSTREVVARMPGMPFSLDWQPDGQLLVISGSEGKLLRQEANGSFSTLADLRDLSAKPWNEIVVDGRGNIYLNSINFDFPGGAYTPGIVALVTPDGAVRQVADGIAFPNGMAITPDNRTLIVAESYASQLSAFDIGEDGSLMNRRVWASVAGSAPDGICLDAEGAVWYADVPNKRCVRVREGGEVLQTVDVDRGCFACMIGGKDNRTLFIVAATWGGPEGMAGGQPSGQLLSVEVDVPKAGWP